MKLKKIMAAVMACSIVCAVPAPMGTYQPGYKLTANAVDVVDSGKCGENAVWTIDSEGKMTISGEGAVSRPTEWYNAETRNKVVSLVIEEGISELGIRMFEGFENLETVSMPENILFISHYGDNAFCDTFFECPKLNFGTCGPYITWKYDGETNSLYIDGNGAIQNYYYMTAGIGSIAPWNQNRDNKIEHIYLSEDVNYIGLCAFFYCGYYEDGVSKRPEITVLNPECYVDSLLSDSVDADGNRFILVSKIYGYENSTAHIFAIENNIPFEALDKHQSETTTTTAAPTTTEGTTTTTETTTTATTAASTSSTAQPSTTSTAASTTAQPTTTTTTSSSALDSRFVGKWELYKCEKNGEDTPFTPNGFELFADGEGKWTFVDGGKNHWTSVDGFLYVRDLTSLPIHIDKFEYLNGELVWKGMAEELDYNLAPETAEYDLNAYGEGIAFYYRRVEDSEQTTTATTTTSQPTTTTTASTTTETTTESTTTLSETSTASESTTEPVTTTATTPANEVSFGDPTGDGKVDAKDASFTLVEYAKLSTGGESSLTDIEKNAADVNKDGKVDSKDASTILQYYAYTSTGGTEPIEVYLGYEGDSVTTTTSDISTETTTTEATKTTTTTTNSTSTTTASTTTTTTTTEPVTTTTEHIDLVFESVENPCPEFDGLTFGWAEPYGTMEERRYQHVMWNFSYNYGFDCDCFFIDAYMRYFGYFHDTNHIWSDKCLSYVNSYGDEIIFYPDKNYIFINGTDYSLESAFGLDYDPSWTFIISNGYDFFVYDGEKMDSITKHIADNVR